MWHVILTVAILVLMVVSCADTGTRHEAQATAGSGGQLLQPERVGKIHNVLSDRSLLCHTRGLGVAEVSRSVSPKVRHKDSISSLN